MTTNSKSITNEDIIQAWSAFSAPMIEAVGDEGDASRKYILNPTLDTLLGDVENISVLDAGSGTGYLCRMLAKRGAQVTGVEPATALFEYAVQREATEQLGITYVQHDLSTLTGYDGVFDVVIANMVLMDIPDYQQAIKNCIAALRSGGTFILAILHPCFDEIDSPNFEQGYGAKGYLRIEEYFEEFVIKQTCGYAFHRPLSAYINLLIDNECTIRRMIEPALSEEGLQALGANSRNAHVPAFIVISASKT